MDSALYESKRNELIGLIDETLKIEIPEPHVGTLRRVRQKCFEDQFEIALIGEYQGGKSTTFNALCDGREISPRGLGGGGIKTSAAIVTAQHISDPSETRDGLSEWAEVHWRTDRELVLGMASLLRRHLLEAPVFQGQLTAEMPAELIAARIDLANPGHKEALDRAVAAEWEIWKKNKSSYSSEEMDLLRIATLQLRYLDTSAWQALKRRSIFSIPEFQKLITFPRNWAAAWAEGPEVEFALSAVSFVFVADVLVRIRAANLARIGCRITDCPGLFASAWDTALARLVMNRADGLWYLFDGRKQIGEGDIRVVRTIQESGLTHKLHASVNLREKSHQGIIEDIIPVDHAILKSVGLGQLKLVPYDARLAFLANQGQLLLIAPDRFGAYDRSCMAFDFDRNLSPGDIDPRKAWCRFIKKQATVAELPQLEEATGLDETTVVDVLKASRLEDILSALEKTVIRSKARSILITNGSEMATKALERYEGDLKLREEALRLKVEEFDQRKQEAEKHLSLFEKEAEELIEDSPLGSNEDSTDLELATEFVRAVFNERLYQRVAELSAKGIRSTKFRYYLTSGDMKAALKSVIADALSQAYQERCQGVVNKWNRGAGEALNRIIDRCKRLSGRIHKRWEQIAEQDLLQGLALPDPSDNNPFSFSTHEQVVDSSAEVMTEILSKTSFLERIGIILLAPIALIFVAFEKIIDLFKSDEELEKENKERLEKAQVELADRVKRETPEIANRISELFENDFHVREMLIAQHKSYFSVFRSSCRAVFKQGLEQVRTEFDDRVRKEKANFQLANADREKLAHEAHRIRTTVISPIRIRIMEFERLTRDVLEDETKEATLDHDA